MNALACHIKPGKKRVALLALLALLYSPALQAADYLYFHADYSYATHVTEGLKDTSVSSAGVNTVELTLDLTPLGKRLSDENTFSLPFLFPKITYQANPEELLSPANVSPVNLYSAVPPSMDHLTVEIPLSYVRLSRISSLGAKLYYEKANYYSQVTFQKSKTYYPSGSAPVAIAAGETMNMHSGLDLYAGLFQWSLGWISTGIGYFYMDYQKPYSAILSGQIESTAIVDSHLVVQGAIVQMSYQVPEDSVIFWGVDVGMLAGGGMIHYSKAGTTNDYFSLDEEPGTMQLSLAAHFGMRVADGLSLRVEGSYQDYIFKERHEFSKNYTGDATGATDTTFMIQAGLFFYF